MHIFEVGSRQLRILITVTDVQITVAFYIFRWRTSSGRRFNLCSRWWEWEDGEEEDEWEREENRRREVNGKEEERSFTGGNQSWTGAFGNDTRVDGLKKSN